MMHVTPRELEVLVLLADGHINKTAARALGVAESTVERMTFNARTRNKMKTTAQLVASALREGLIQ